MVAPVKLSQKKLFKTCRHVIPWWCNPCRIQNYRLLPMTLEEKQKLIESLEYAYAQILKAFHAEPQVVWNVDFEVLVKYIRLSWMSYRWEFAEWSCRKRAMFRLFNSKVRDHNSGSNNYVVSLQGWMTSGRMLHQTTEADTLPGSIGTGRYRSLSCAV